MSTLANYFDQDGYALRRAIENDVPSLVSIINEAYSYQDEAKGSPRTNPEHLLKRMGETELYALVKSESIVGCVYLKAMDDSLHFGLLTLIPGMRKTGLGKALMTAIIAYASNKPYTHLELDYMSLAPWLKRYYEQYGFRETGEVTRWGSIDLIGMRKTL